MGDWYLQAVPKIKQFWHTYSTYAGNLLCYKCIMGSKAALLRGVYGASDSIWVMPAWEQEQAFSLQCTEVTLA